MSDLRFFNLNIPAPKRLALMREAFASHAKRYPRCPDYAKPASWREVRDYGLHTYADAFALCDSGLNDGKPVIYSHASGGLPVRKVKFADEMCGSNIDHCGWYAGNDGCRGVVRGIVGYLSHGRFLSGYHWSDNDESVLFVGHIFDSEREATRDADREAEAYADMLRDDSERYDVMREAEDHAEAVSVDVGRAFQARNVSAWHREYCRDRVEELRAARTAFDAANEAYEKG